MNKLKEVRTAAGLTQEELANMIGSTKQYISSLERGERNILQIRQDTMTRLCSALNCTADNLIVAAQFERGDGGKLIVDKLYYDPRVANGSVAEINGEYFLLPSLAAFCTSKPAEEQLKPMARKVAESAQELPQYMYVQYNCVPRQGFKIELGRAIKDAEFEELKTQYNLTEDDISDRFISSKGKIYGSYAKHYTVVQIRSNSALHIETELKNMGIQADNIAPGRVNVRVE